MKKVSFMMIAAFAAVSSLFVSCGEDENGSVVITLDATEFEFGAAVNGEIKSTNPLKTVTLLKDQSTAPGGDWPLTSFGSDKPIVDKKDGSYTIRLTGLAAGSYTIRATDGDGVEDNKNFTVKAAATPVAKEINMYTAVIMAAQGSADAGSYATSTNKLYKSSEAVANAATIDFIYFYQVGGDLAEIFSPKSAKNDLNGYKDMPTKRDTKFKLVTAVDQTTFEAVKDDAKIVEVATGLTASEITKLIKGDVVAFQTADNKLGLFRVTDLVDGASGKITITVKVQK